MAAAAQRPDGGEGRWGGRWVMVCGAGRLDMGCQFLSKSRSSGNHSTVRACDADGVQSGGVRHVLAKELRLEPLPAPPAPLRLAPWCVNCGSPAMMRCMACGSSICGRECAEKWWKKHRPDCRRLQAVAFGEEYAREKDRSYRMINAAYDGDLRSVKRLQIELSVAVRKP